MNAIRDAIRTMARRAAAYRRAPAVAAPAPAPTPEPTAEDVVVSPPGTVAEVEVQEPIAEQIPVPVDDELPGLEEDLGLVVVPAPDDPREWLSTNTIEGPRPVCQSPETGSYGWFGTHWPMRAVITREFAGLECEACGLRWPEPPEDPRDE